MFDSLGIKLVVSLCSFICIYLIPSVYIDVTWSVSPFGLMLT